MRTMWVGVIAACIMLAFETTKQFFHPKITIWTSHGITILFTTLMAGFIGLVLLKIEERFHLELASREECYRLLFEEHRRRAEEALRQSEEQYRLLFESNPLPMWVFNRSDLRFLAVNEAAVRHYGFSRQEFLAMTIAEIRPEEDIPALLKATSGTPLFGGIERRTARSLTSRL
jgi:PAS domain-containing protein